MDPPDQFLLRSDDRQTKILVIDDEALIRQSFRDYLEDCGYGVVEAANGREGLDRFAGENPDLVLVDLRMPLVDGIEVLEHVKSHAPETPVIVVSGTGAIDDAIQALHLGANDYLLKPLEDLSILRHTIENALERTRLARENRAYQEHLEQLVKARTEQLEEANVQLSQINRRLRLIVESTRKLSVCRDVQSFGGQLLTEFARHMQTTGGSFYMVKETGLELIDSLDGDHVPRFVPFPLKAGSVTQRVLSDRVPLLIQNLANEPELASSGWNGYRDGSLLVFPLMGESEGPIAVLSLHNRTDPPFVEQDKEIGTILGSFSSETLRTVRMSEALQHSEEMFRTITSSAQDAIFMVDEEGRIVYWNQAAEHIFGWTATEAIGRNLYTLIAPGREPVSFRDTFVRSLTTGCFPSGRTLSTVSTRKNGSEFPAELSLASVEIKGHWSIIGILRDISEREQTEGRVRLLATAAEQAAESILVIDPGGVIVDVNPAFEQTTGYTREEVIGRHLGVLEDRQSAASGYREMWDAVKANRPWQGLLNNSRKDGSRYPADATFAPVRDATGRVVSFVSVQRDVSHERELELRLLQAQKMEAVGTLAGGIAHDFNNILNAIMGYSELALMHLDPNARSYRSIEKIIRAGERAADLVKQILTISRQVEVQKKHVLVQPILKETLKLLRSTLPSTISIRQDIDSRCGPVLADPTQIHQVIMNLCTNAYHAMRDSGGELEVTLYETEIDDPTDFVSMPASSGRHVCISVRDSGCGMDAETMNRIFDPYFTTKTKGEGTGLGLATVHGIVRNHGGAIQVQSEIGTGTIFRIYLPLRKGETAGEVLQVRDTEQWRGSGRILLVDDEPSITEVGQMLLGHSGYQVVSYNDSPEALRAFKNDPEGFDLVITDLTMPQLTGLELARGILSIRPDLPVIVCSGYNDTLNVQSALSVGVSEYVMKPISGLDLLKTVHRVLHK